MEMNKEKILSKLREVVAEINSQEDSVIYFRDKDAKITKIIYDKCEKALMHSMKRKATLLVGRNNMYALCKACKKVLENRDIIQTPYAELELIIYIDDPTMLEVIVEKD